MRTFVLTLLLCLAAFNVQAQDKPAQPLTQEDIDGALRNATSKMTSELRRLEKNVTISTQKEREALQKQQEELQKKQLEEQDKLRADIARNAEIAERQAREAREQSFKNQKLLIGMSMGAVALIGISILVWALKSPTEKVVVHESHTHTTENKPLMDPEIPDLKKAAESMNVGQVPFYLSLREGEKPLCVAQLVPGQRPLIVSVNNIPTKIGWDDRKKKVAAVLTRS